MRINQPVLMRRFKGCMDLNARVNLIEQTLPDKPVNPDTGAPIDYHSERYRQIEDLIAMFRALSKKVPPRNHKDICEITKLRRQITRITDRHARLKESNKQLRRQLL